MFTIEALPHVRLAITLRPLFDGHGSELRDAFLLAAALALANNVVDVVALLHHASSAFRLQHALLGTPFAEHLVYKVILGKFFLTVAIAIDQLSLLFRRLRTQTCVAVHLHILATRFPVLAVAIVELSIDF